MISRCAFALILAAALASRAGAAEPQARKPNIVFILADDLGWGDLGAYGQKKVRTPRLDRMAVEGMRFTQFYAGSTVCAPSRCALMTGRHMGHASVRGNADERGVGLLPEDVTVAEVLKRDGYATGAFGKWGLGRPGNPGMPTRKGFDEHFGYLLQHHAHRYYTDHLFRNEERVAVDEDRDFSHDLIAEAAFDFVRRNRDRPFFLYLPFTVPHAELRAPEESLAEYRGSFPEKPFRNDKADRSPERRGYRSQPEPRAAFAAMVTRMDRDVGRLLDLFQDLGIDGDTVVFFSSDNGPHQEGGGDPKFFGSAGGLRGIKRDLYEGGIRVPMIVRWPGKIAASAVSDQVWAMWDFLPTAAEIAGAPAPPGIDGISMVPALRGLPQRSHEFLYFEFHERGFQQAARLGDWKAVRPRVGRPIELYNLRVDPAETTDLARDHPDIAARIEERLRTARADSPIFKRRARV